MKLTIGHFFIAWWMRNIGITWYIIACVWSNAGEFEIGTGAVILFAYLTKEMYFNCLIICSTLFHIVILCTLIFMYMYESKQKIVLIGSIILSIIPNHYNPYNNNLIIKLCIYCLIVYRIEKSPGLPVSKYITYSWILFVHLGFLVLLPLHLVYDTYYYKINFNV